MVRDRISTEEEEEGKNIRDNNFMYKAKHFLQS